MMAVQNTKEVDGYEETNLWDNDGCFAHDVGSVGNCRGVSGNLS